MKLVIFLIFLFPIVTTKNTMSLKTNEISVLNELKKITEGFQADFSNKGIDVEKLEQKNKEKHSNILAFGDFISNLLNQQKKPQVDGVSRKAEKDIGKKIFVEEIYDWVSSFKSLLEKEDKNNTPILIGELKQKLNTPFKTEYLINKHIYDELCKVLPDSLAPATRANAAAAMIKILSNYTPKSIADLFKPGAPIRKDLRDDESLKPNILPSVATLYDVLMLPGVEDEHNKEHAMHECH